MWLGDVGTVGICQSLLELSQLTKTLDPYKWSSFSCSVLKSWRQSNSWGPSKKIHNQPLSHFETENHNKGCFYL